MKIFVAGATGALGKPLVRQLVERGHEVTGMTRSESKQDVLRELGATPAVADALDPDAVAQAVAQAQPDVIVHQMTAIEASFNPRRMERAFAPTNRLRTEGTDHLLAAGRAVGVQRFVAQSFAPWPYARTGGMVKSEDDPLDTTPPAQVRTTLDAIKYLEKAVTSADWTEGIALRYGGFYGPGTSIGLDPLGEQVEMIRQRKFPLAGKGSGVWSFIHVEDAAIGHRRGGRARHARRLQRGRRRTGADLRVAAGARQGGRARSLRATCRSGSPGSPAAT